ncbi:MAG: glycosyltransferase [Rhodospirillales bacterium]|nr:glycosyltransferase [Rhodospirillales bacterium]
MRVLQAMAGADFGGAEAFFTRLAIGFNRAGLDQQVVIRSNRRRADVLRRGGVDPIEMKFGGRLDIGTPLALKRLIKSYKPDIVLTWMNRATRMCPKGDFVHLGRLGGYYDLKYYQKCDHLIGNTQDIAEYLAKEGWPAERAHYLPNFVAEEETGPVERGDFFTPKGSPLLLALGRLHTNKAFDVLLDALARLPDAYLWIAGEGPERAALESQAEKLAVKPRVRFLGWRDDTAALLATADVFICPSRHEPLGNVVLEAWAQRVPVVAADSLGPGILIEHMESGVLAPVDDPISLANGIDAVLEDRNLRERIVDNGYAAYRENFTEAAVVDQYLEFFRQVLG